MRTQSAILITTTVAFVGGLFVAGSTLSLRAYQGRPGIEGNLYRPELLIGKPPVPRS